MEWAVVVLSASLLTGIGVAEYVYKNDEIEKRSSNYVFVVILWWILVPVAAFKSLRGDPIEYPEGYFGEEAYDESETEESGEDADH